MLCNWLLASSPSEQRSLVTRPRPQHGGPCVPASLVPCSRTDWCSHNSARPGSLMSHLSQSDSSHHRWPAPGSCTLSPPARRWLNKTGFYLYLNTTEVPSAMLPAAAASSRMLKMLLFIWLVLLWIWDLDNKVFQRTINFQTGKTFPGEINRV